MSPLFAVLLMMLPMSSAHARKGSPREAVKLMRSGVAAYQEARFDEALEDLTKALEEYPSLKTASAFRAMVLWTTGDVAAARRDARFALSLKPVDAESHAARGLAHFVLRRWGPAASDFIAAAKRNPKYALAYFGMGSVRSSQERLDEALTNLNRAVKLYPRGTVAYVVRGTVFDKMKEHRRAVRDYTRVLKLRKEFTWAYFYRGRAYRELKDYPRAVADFSQFLKHHAGFREALYLRSNAYFLSGDHRRAVEDLDRIIEIDPGYGLAYANRGVAHSELGRKDQALKDLRKAAALMPSKADKIQSQIDIILDAGGVESGDGPRGSVERIVPLEPLPPERLEDRPRRVVASPEERLADEALEDAAAAAEQKRSGRLPIDTAPIDEGDFLFIR